MSSPPTAEATMPSAKPTIPFRLKLTLLGGALAAIPVAIAGMLLLNENEQAIERTSLALQMAVADDVARTVRETVSNAHEGLASVGQAVTNPSLDPETTERIIISLIASSETLDHAAIYDREGSLVDIVSQSDFDGAMSDTLNPEVLAAAAEVGSGHGATDLEDGRVRLLMAVPMYVGEQITGFVATRCSLDPLQRRIERLNELRFEGRPSSVFVIDEERDIIAHPDRSSLLENANGVGMLEGVGDNALREDLELTGHFETDGVPMIGSVVALREVPWGVLTQVPEDIAFESLTEMRRIVGITLLTVIFFALLAAFIVARQITRPIQELSDFANDLAARKFDRRVTVDTRDELGLLGRVMNGAAIDLQQSEERIREEEAIRADLGRYLPHELVDKVVKREQDMALGGARRPISVLFADVVAFTPLTDKLSAEEVVTLLNELFTILTEIVFRHGGTIDKFVGDCVMAIWGAPTPQEDHAERAVAAAEDMMRWLEAGNAAWEERYGVTVKLAIGVNSGEAVVGNVGSDTRMEYTAIGDTVNVAARLEGIARPMQILITKATADAVDADLVDLVELGPRALTGREGDVVLYEVRA